MGKLKPKRKFGQNFLVDSRVAKDLVKAGTLSKKDIVLEVGAGTGAVTRELAARAGRVLAIEIDNDLIPKLKRNLKGWSNVKIISADILKYPLAGVSVTAANFKIIGSLPYQITSPFIHKLIKEGGWQTAVFLLQKEVAEKITAQPPKATYLSNFVQAFADAKLIREVSPQAFWPQPKVEGAIVKLKSGADKRKVSPEGWSRFLHRGFSHPRKMLKKNISLEIIKKTAISPERRPATLSVDEWSRLYSITLE